MSGGLPFRTRTVGPMHLLTTPIGRLRVVAFVEGISYLVLLLVAMPLKYAAGMPQAVSLVGAVHGALFVAFVFAVGHVWVEARWSFGRVVQAMVASILPFATFWLEVQLRKEQEAALALTPNP